jgi:hypothetical protein
MIILSPIHYQSFLEIRNTAWCVTVPILEYKLAMSKFIKEGVVTELIPYDCNFEKLTWIPCKVDDSMPITSTEARRHANLSKRDPGHVMWWAHNGMQIYDQDWDVNMTYFSNQSDDAGLPASWVVQAPTTTTVVPVMTQTPAVVNVPVSALPNTAHTGQPKPTTSWYPPYPGSTRRSKYGQPKKPRSQMEFKCMQMPCPGDENIIPLYRPEDSAPDAKVASTLDIGQLEISTSQTKMV